MNRTFVAVLALGLLALAPAARAQEAAPPEDALIATVAHSDYGQNAEAFTALADLVNKAADPAAQQPLAAKLAALLTSDATPNAKSFVFEQLSLIGGEDVVPALAQALANPDTFEGARYALQRNPSPAAEAALVSALSGADSARKIALVNAIGARQSASTVAALAPLTADADAAVAEAAVDALARIPSEDAARALVDAKVAARPELKPALGLALLTVAERAADAGNRTKAATLLARLYAPSEPKGVRLAAFKRLALLLGEKGAPFIVDSMKGSDTDVQKVAVETVPEVPGTPATLAFAAALRDLPPALQPSLIAALAARGDKAALQAVTETLSSADPAVRLAALPALAVLGDASTVPVLAAVASEREGAEAGLASDSLDRLAGPGIDEEILKGVQGTYPAAARAEFIRSLAARRTANAVPTLLTAATDADEAVRTEAIRALGILAAKEDMPQLVSLLVSAPTPDTERAVAAAAARFEAGVKTTDLLAALPVAQSNPAAYASVIRVLGRIGDDSGLDAVRAALASDNADVKNAAVRSLADWPTQGPLNDLLALAQTCPDDTHRSLALQGYLRMLTIPTGRPAAETLAMYEEGLKLVKTPEETKLALAGLSEVRDPRVFEVLKPYVENPEFAAEAKAAIDRLNQVVPLGTASDNPEPAKDALDGNPETRWATGTDQKPGQWFQVDLGWEMPVSSVTLDATGSPGDYPRGYQVFVSNDPQNPGEPVATGAGQNGQPVTVIEFATKTGRYVRIVQTADSPGAWWSIHELTVH